MNITKQELSDAIPKECFERSNLISFSYLFFDIFLVTVGFIIAHYLNQLSFTLQILLYPLWWVMQGTFMTSLWVLSHECGHRAFSESIFINDTVGFIFHSLLLVPCHSWRLTHGQHHAYTSNLDKDQVFLPAEKENDKKEEKVTLLGVLPEVVGMLTIGWFLYLFLNVGGNRALRGKKNVNHFTPSSPLFHPRHRWLIIQSNIGLILMLTLLFTLGYKFGFLWILKHYIIPYFVVNFWLVLITFLQHKHEKIVYYDEKSWNFVSGSLQTVDRDYGIINFLLHRITDTHVCHHIFHQIPFYNAEKATKAIKEKLGKYYLEDNTPIVQALFREISFCRYVDGNGVKHFVDE